MSSQTEHHAGDASQTRSGILTPTSENTKSLSDGVASGGKKRKREGSSIEDLLRDKFVVRPYPATGFVKSQSLQPLMLLPRSKLPLSFFDFYSTAKGLAKSRLFEAHVKILELEERMGSQPTVLVARLNDSRLLYAVERESHGLYVLCQLGSWINLHDLRAAAVVSKQELPERACLQVPTIPEHTSETSQFSKSKRLAIEAIQSMVKRPPIGLLTESQGDSLSPANEPEQLTVDTPLPAQKAPRQCVESQENHNLAAVDDVLSQPTATEIFENVRTQYLETLYLSKASLAYFVKGPLSRARAAFHLDYESTLDLNDHINFLESLVMSNPILDKKYRGGIPNFISLVDIRDHSAEDAAQAIAKPKKKRISKKMKPGKNGLYPTEEPLIREWWAAHDDDAEIGAPGSSREELTKTRIYQLRIRETQLQLIIILEILALRPLATTEHKGEGLPSALPTIEAVETKDNSSKSKKKADHLTVLIDMHIDRLCIWQSIALELTNAPTSESLKASPKSFDSGSQLKHTDNVLRDFCVEVITPFFQSRLPAICAAINRKFGGPVVMSPPKPKLSKASSYSGALSRPGAATKRPVPIKPGRSLKRVLTDDRERRSMSSGPNKKIALMRSATMPIIPGMKRETSETPSISSTPAMEPHSLEASRGGVSNSKRFSRPDIDPSSLLPEKNSKAKKKALVDEQLKEAISALKKPNRELAGQALAEIAEQRTVISNSRKSKKPIRNPPLQSVQISATPKTNRHKDMFPESQQSSLERMVGEVSVVPVSSAPRIPQSSSRSAQGAFPSVQATPSRKVVPALPRPGKDMDSGGVPSSPLHFRRSSSQLFTAVPDSAYKDLNAVVSCGLNETPIKKRPVSSNEHSHLGLAGIDSEKENNQSTMRRVISNECKEALGKDTDDSIYKALGWDDNDLEDLA
ncbi:uncharacterized protein L3040_003297 [Drepanopeziza brunnea f. sp. 'multigermtubi']|uniref:DNA replication regulator Sld3 C-terminal domain-containing protein n=1 Tax=Marssonina brunnea f. sp. multigermtubi (strain MB_m1) TaxID=1072389 RepID=K1WS19_MARBU|nr:uncharacterized protein MBM_05857 [Drepanopeziza brunnea f. sp. 'multigermtubi' MB_m1]EKD15846.1 hypothetical protein MBM_05857 [Drepanopeziza brunnea f. sp. 'multigermtubi' MB_m1]KAJ5047473.1 hypothetical protein L3040_003297 [Drepanopeziza brunnea f. sp. 'multigermtubi']